METIRTADGIALVVPTQPIVAILDKIVATVDKSDQPAKSYHLDCKI